MLPSKSKITHQDKHFNVFLNGPETFALFEIHDISFISGFLNDENVSANDKRTIRKFIKEAIKFDANTNNSNSGTAAVIPIHYSKTQNSGQYSTKLSLHNLQKPLRDEIFDHGEYANLDIVNKGFTIIHEVAKINGVELPAIKEFIQNRDEIYAENNHCFGNSEIAKKNFCSLLFHSVHFDGESAIIGKMIDELILVNEIFQHPDYPEFTTSKIMEVYNTLIMKLIAEFLVLNGIVFPKCYSLNGDAIFFQPLKPFEINDIEDYIFQQTNLNIKLH